MRAARDRSSLSFFLLALAALTACDDGANERGNAVDAGACEAAPVVNRHDIQLSPHVTPDEFSAQTYTSNPPSSGPHCGQWASWSASDQGTVSRCQWIHNLEHGGVVLLYNCPGGCPATVSLLEAAAAAAVDPACAKPRVLVTSDPALPGVVGAAAWGATLVSTCAGDATRTALETFLREQIDQGPERICF